MMTGALIRWNCSGILRASASLRRPATVRSAFQPIKKSFAPALSARLASTDASSAKDGKIYQVIGKDLPASPKNFSDRRHWSSA